MPIYAVGDKVPQIHPDAFIAPTASIVGNVSIGAGASVWYGAVVRGDTSYAVIGEGANVQDGAAVHGRADLPALIGREASLAHNSVVHGAEIGEQALIANGAMVLDGAVVGARALIGAGAIVLAGVVIPEGMLAVGAPAIVKRSILGGPSEEWVTGNPGRYKLLAAEHRAGLREITIEEALGRS
jgi:carbonic anhydrase/acetyltransferase-like protein (isoleucine patch superfamily)